MLWLLAGTQYLGERYQFGYAIKRFDIGRASDGLDGRLNVGIDRFATEPNVNANTEHYIGRLKVKTAASRAVPGDGVVNMHFRLVILCSLDVDVE